ncbi:unnamed protein product [marine sediment metagenome]|jgi:uncharacterized membrane protein|uniref:Uncharacterized protein n=1 Tax=marine sediment metagenome TaxID=412755 RepID=X0YGA3_9ZZZZ|tara:strand:+ start:116 stop:349 length:234 start_codon:yes stop_codon:yes gene_type:complete
MAKIKKEELEQVVAVKNKLDSVVAEIGVLETQKHALLHKVAEVNEKLAEEKKNLEESYGKISIDLETGEYKEIKEEE